MKGIALSFRKELVRDEELIKEAFKTVFWCYAGVSDSQLINGDFIQLDFIPYFRLLVTIYISYSINTYIYIVVKCSFISRCLTNKMRPLYIYRNKKMNLC